MKQRKKNEMKYCLGQQGRDFLFGEFPDKCIDCDQFDLCHKLSIATSLQSIADGVDLLIQNGLATDKLLGFAELEKLHKKKSKNKKDN